MPVSCDSKRTLWICLATGLLKLSVFPAMLCSGLRSVSFKPLLDFSSDIHVLLFERSSVLPLGGCVSSSAAVRIDMSARGDGSRFFASSRQGSLWQRKVLHPFIATDLETDFERINVLGKGTLLGVDDNQFCEFPVPGGNLGIGQCFRLVERQDHPLTCHGAWGTFDLKLVRSPSLSARPQSKQARDFERSSSDFGKHADIDSYF